MHIYPSLLAADQAKMPQIIKELDPIAHGYHLDVMDGKFVPTQGISVQTINTIAKLSSRPLWVHLMVTAPETYLPQLKVNPGTLISFHYETSDNAQDMIKQIKKSNWQPGIAIKPDTSIEKIFPYLNSLHHVLIMSVE